MRDFLAVPFIIAGWVLGVFFGLTGYQPEWLKKKRLEMEE